MAPKSKSVLDGVPVDDKAFPLNKGTAKPTDPKSELVGIVGHCPKCGAPIYGHTVTEEAKVKAIHSCHCHKGKDDSVIGSIKTT